MQCKKWLHIVWVKEIKVVCFLLVMWQSSHSSANPKVPKFQSLE